MEIESRVTNTGPVSATMAPMTVELVGPKGKFGKLQLPEVKTNSKGTDVHIDPQRIDISDYEAFLGFVQAIMQQDSLILSLENGEGTVKAMGMKSKIVYKKQIELSGMNGPKARITKVEGSKENAQIGLQVFNPSPLEIDLGTAIYEVQGEDGTKIMNIEGQQHITRGGSQHTLSGKVEGTVTEGPGKLVGLGAKEDAWTQDSNKFINIRLNLGSELAAL